jgi:hypothetical protein
VRSSRTVRLRKYAVSSSVAVPCVITTPSSGASRAATACSVSVRWSQSAGPIAVLPTDWNGTGTISATWAISGTRARSSSGPTFFPVSMYSQTSRLSRPIEEIVPPVPIRATRPLREAVMWFPSPAGDPGSAVSTRARVRHFS